MRRGEKYLSDNKQISLHLMPIKEKAKLSLETNIFQNYVIGTQFAFQFNVSSNKRAFKQRIEL